MKPGYRNPAAVTAIFIIVTALAGYISALRQANDRHGPAHIGFAGGTVVVADGLHLSWLDSESGGLIEQRDLDRLGISTPLMDLQLLTDGTLLIGEMDSGRILRCGRTRARCDTLADLSWLVGRFFKFHFDAENDRLFVVGTHDRSLWLLEPPYDKSRFRVLRDDLKAPNEIWLSSDGTLWVADTDAHRVVELELGLDFAEETGHELSGRAAPSNKAFPLDFAGNGKGPWWVLLSGPSYLHGQIVEYANDGSPKRAVALPAPSDPIAVEAMDDGALVADMKGFALYRIDHSGKISRFGDDAYYAALLAMTAERLNYERRKNLALIALVLGVVGALFIAALAARSQGVTAEDAKDRKPAPALEAVDGVYWLEPDPAALRRLRRMAIALTLMSPPAFAIGYSLTGWNHDVAPALLLMLSGLFLGPYLWLHIHRLIPAIGTDGSLLYLRAPGDWHLLEPGRAPDQAYMSAKTLLLGRRILVLYDNHGRPIYEPSHVNRHIRPLIPPIRILGEGSMFLAALRTGHRATWMMVTFFLATTFWVLFR